MIWRVLDPLFDRYEAAMDRLTGRYGFQRVMRTLILACWVVLLVTVVTAIVR